MTLTNFKDAMRLEFFGTTTDTTLSDTLLENYYNEALGNIFNELMKAENKLNLPITEHYSYTIAASADLFTLESANRIAWINDIIINIDSDGNVIPLSLTTINNIYMNSSAPLGFFARVDTQKIQTNDTTTGSLKYEAIVVEDALDTIADMDNYDSIILETGKDLCRKYLTLY